jgi:hypothetical protein
MNPLKNMHITCPYGWRIHPIYKDRRFHHGVDLRAPLATEIYAVLNGTVISVKTDSAYGLSVRIDHGHGVVSFYAHLSASKVELGQLVTAGDVIALSGNTGLSTGPHLHFGIYRDGISVDPLKFLKESEDSEMNIEKIVIRKEGKEYEGYLIEGIAYGVVRPLFESQGQSVTWREADREVVISDGPLEKLRDIKMIVQRVV